MTDDKKERLLRGINEYYKNRKDILAESTDKETVLIGNICATKINGSFEDYAKSKGLINVDGIQWSK